MADQKPPDMAKDQRLMFFLSRGLPTPDNLELEPPASPFAPRKSDPASLARAETQVAALKAATYTTWRQKTDNPATIQFVPHKFGTWADLSEMGKTAVLDSWVDWNGVSRRDKRSEFTRSVDASKLPQEVAEQFLSPKALDEELPAAGKQRGKKSLRDLMGRGDKPVKQKGRTKGIER